VRRRDMRVSPRRLILALFPVLLAQGDFSAAQEYPNRPIRLVIPWGSGGAADVTFRLWTPHLSEALGQPVVVDNRGGASSIIGLDIVAKSSPDGYTLGMVNIAYGINPFRSRKMPFDSRKDLLPVSLTTQVPLVLTVNPSVNSVKELIALAKAKPDGMKFAGSGYGSGTHMAAELFLDVTGIRMLYVPYKGGGQTVMSVIAGETTVGFLVVANSLPHIRSGKLKALGISSLKRDRVLPAVPTIAEVIGVPDFEVADWHGVVVPAGTPPTAIRRLHQAIHRVLAQPDVRDRIEGIGVQVVASTPAELAAYMDREFARWPKLIKSRNIRVED
jgi:tripartite-type tricarboxylate transporter receptor subunit TctC